MAHIKLSYFGTQALFVIYMYWVHEKCTGTCMFKKMFLKYGAAIPAWTSPSMLT